MKNIYALFLLCILSLSAMAGGLHETEPNDSIPAANILPIDVFIQGQICAYPAVDWFRIVVPTAGIIKLKTQISTADPAHPNLTFTLYSKTGNQFGAFQATTGFGSLATDSFDYYCRAADTFYIQVYNGSALSYCFDYYLKWSHDDAVFGNDVEPNNNIATAVPVAYQTNTTAQLGFTSQPVNGISEDYFRIIPTGDGLLRIFTEIEGAANGINVSLLDVNGNSLGDQYPSVGVTGTPVSDTLLWGCIAADTFYLKFFINDINYCGVSYRFSYDIVAPVFGNDVEPNNSFAAAQLLPGATNNNGHLSYNYGPGWANRNTEDYYVVTPGSDGTIRVITKAEGSANSLNLSRYNKTLSSLGDVYPGVSNNGGVEADTFYYSCLSTDTFYFKIYTNDINYCGVSYQLRYDINPAFYGNDAEPNESFAQAQHANMATNTDGHLNYSGTTNTDYWYFVKPDTGFLWLTFQSEVEDTTADHFSVTLYDKGQNQIGYINPFTGTNHVATLDSIHLISAAADTFFIKVTANTHCGSYRFSLWSPTTIVTGLKEASAPEKIRIAPNVSSGSFNFYAEDMALADVSIYDASGKLMRVFKPEKHATAFAISISDLANGIYLARISTANGEAQVHRLVLAK